MLGLVVLLLALAVVAMHQLGGGHHAMSAGHGAPAARHAETFPAQVGVPAPMVAEMTGPDCREGCAAGAAHELGMGGLGASMVCLAVLPLLLIVAGSRRGLLTRRRGRLAASRAGLRGVRAPSVVGLGPPGPSLLGLCVSRT